MLSGIRCLRCRKGPTLGMHVPFELLLLLLLVLSETRNATASAVLIADNTMSVMIELSSRYPFCKIHKDRGDIQRMLLQSDQRRIRQVPRESVIELEGVCESQGSYGYQFRGALGFIYPRTKWCGPGSIARNYDDLGEHTREDRCCREHDMCPNVLKVGECRRGLCNTGTFTRSHCECDARFRRCLQAVNTETANTIGAIFYNVVQVTCFQERSPCSPHQRFVQNDNSGGNDYDCAYDFFDGRGQSYINDYCDFEFRTSNLYVPKTLNNFLPWIHHNPRSRSFLPGATTLKERLGVSIASVGFATFNVAREIIERPRILWERPRHTSRSAQIARSPSLCTKLQTYEIFHDVNDDFNVDINNAYNKNKANYDNSYNLNRLHALSPS